MLTSYNRAAMSHSHYEMVEDDQSFYGEIPACHGVWANAKTLEACREELQEGLEDWLSLGLRPGLPITEIDGIRLESGEPVPVDI